MAKVKLEQQILIVNIAIVVGLAYQLFRGAPIFAVGLAGVLLIVLCNLYFVFRIRKSRKKTP